MISRKLIPFLLLSAVTANAAVNVNWTSAGNAIKQDDGTTNAPSTWYAQLIWSSDNSISALNPMSPFVPTDGEVVLKEQSLNGFNAAGFLSGGTVDATGLVPGDGIGGYVYTRVFNVLYSVAPSTPTFYGNSVAVSGPLAADIIAPPTPMTTSHAPVVTVNQRIVAIPEPSTYALAAVGIAAALWRRRRKA